VHHSGVLPSLTYVPNGFSERTRLPSAPLCSYSQKTPSFLGLHPYRRAGPSPRPSSFTLWAFFLTQVRLTGPRSVLLIPPRDSDSFQGPRRRMIAPFLPCYHSQFLSEEHDSESSQFIFCWSFLILTVSLRRVTALFNRLL